MDADPDELMQINASLVQEQDDKWLLNTGGIVNVWVPKSVARFDAETGVLSITRWQAEVRGML